MDLAPTARTALRTLLAGARAASKGMAWVARASWTHRRLLNAIALRVAWWASLWLAIETATAMVDIRAELAVDPMLTRFAVGLGLCWAVTVLAGSKHLRWTAVALGTVHGTLGLVLWLLAGGG